MWLLDGLLQLCLCVCVWAVVLGCDLVVGMAMIWLCGGCRVCGFGERLVLLFCSLRCLVTCEVVCFVVICAC